MFDQTTIAFSLLVFTSLLAIVNPLSAVPMFLAMTAGFERPHRSSTLRKAIATAIIVLVVFGLLGTWILGFFGITTQAFRITGGLLFLGIGTEMLRAKRSRVKTTKEEELEAERSDEVGIIPLGMPALAGPGAITTVITLIPQARNIWEMASVYISIVLVMGISWLVLGTAPWLLRRFGQTGLNVMTRLMGLIVMVVGTQFIIDGVRAIVLDTLRQV